MRRERTDEGGWDPLPTIAELERRLARDPRDADAHLGLARIYEYHRGDERWAKRHYLQHLVATLGHPDADAALSALRGALAGGRGDAMTLITIGTIHAYRDESDEALAAMTAGTVWTTHETRHYRLNAVAGSTADGEMRRLMDEREASLREILELFALPAPPAEPIVYYLYESRIHKALVTGDPMPAHALTRRGEIHAVYGPDFDTLGLHEDVHVVLRGLGRPPRLLEEGAALYADRRRGAGERRGGKRPRRTPGVIAGLLEDGAFTGGDTAETYATAASFVGFLVETYGVERFKALYGSWGRDVDAEMRGVYGRGVSELEAEWLAQGGGG